MKLDRNINPDGKGKYALIKLREPGAIQGFTPDKVNLVVKAEAVDFGGLPQNDFFVIRLKDKYAATALTAYAAAATADDPEYGEEIYALATKAENHPNKKKPD